MKRSVARVRPWLSWLFAAVLAVGGVAHWGHHVADPDCDAAASPHPCVSCSALHGAALASEAVAAGPPARLVVSAVVAPVTPTTAAPARSACGPRAPPVA
jgi:hypothetical protein